MIKLIFTAGRETLCFRVENRYIFYTDRKWKSWIRCIPKDEEFVKKILMSRNRIPNLLIKMFELTAKEKEEYEGAKTEDELADLIIKDAKSKGAVLRSRE